MGKLIALSLAGILVFGSMSAEEEAGGGYLSSLDSTHLAPAIAVGVFVVVAIVACVIPSSGSESGHCHGQ